MSSVWALPYWLPSWDVLPDLRSLVLLLCLWNASPSCENRVSSMCLWELLKSIFALLISFIMSSCFDDCLVLDPRALISSEDLKFATSGASFFPLTSETTLERCVRFLDCWARSSASFSLFSCSSRSISPSNVAIISESAAVLFSRVMISFSRMAASSSSSRCSISISLSFYNSCSFSF